jgi:DNA-binding response OmpR family regulator
MNILVVEDNRRIADGIVRGLEHKKYNATACYDGESAIEKLYSGKWHAVILDWMLPLKSGPEILEYMREQEMQIPVLFLTARGEVSDRVEMLRAGADDYLVKPFDFIELLARLEALLRRPQHTLSQNFSVGSLKMDTAKKKVTRNGKTIDLSATEYRLLEYLLRNAGQVKNETQILENVWDYADESLSNKVSVYIRYLRNKIDRDFPDQPDLIHTVRGMGYVLEEK